MKNIQTTNFLSLQTRIDIVDGGARHLTVSGSRCVEKLRESLDEATESRLLADEVRMIPLKISSFTGRAHGYLLKEPVKTKAFLMSLNLVEAVSDSKGRASVVYTRSDSHWVLGERNRKRLEVSSDALCTAQDDSAIKMRWLAIREKLHAGRPQNDEIRKKVCRRLSTNSTGLQSTLPISRAVVRYRSRSGNAITIFHAVCWINLVN
jgi:hypothetical protein